MVKVCMSSNSEFSMVVPSVTGFDFMYNVLVIRLKNSTNINKMNNHL